MNICRASSPPGQNARRFADDIFECIFVNEDVKISILRDSNDNKSALV